MRQSNARFFDILLTALAPMSWGTTYIVATELLPSGHPLLVASLRSLPIGLLMTLAFRKLPKGVWWWRILLLGSLNIGIFQALLFVAAYRLPGGVAATAGAIQPLLVVLLSWPILREQPTRMAIKVAIAGFLGIGLLVLGPEARLDAIGIVAAIVGAATMALGTVLVKRWERPVSLLVFTAWQLTVGGAILLPVALITEGPLDGISTTNLWGFIYLGLIGTGIAYALWFRGIDKLQASAVSYLGLLSPVVASIMGLAFLNQTFTLIQLLGVTIILISVVVGQRASHSNQKHHHSLPKIRS
ncbi:DMT family transporter [Vacuolonema iberomarrocanum]|uniref:DMT family transporter n=1 Tax=Vacuolonema iberomarrocanum TaxID=3454632 RepID=UPI0019FFCEA1|nr:DMT family transporter [filamentous cyanobacterium LEGE 07170]